MNDLFTPTTAELLAELEEIWPEGLMDYRHFTITKDPDRWHDPWVATHDNYTGPDCDYPILTGPDEDDLIEQIDEWLADCPHNHTTEGLCHWCAGSGEGYTEGTTCSHCRGMGTGGEYCEDCDENVEYDDYE